MDGKDSRLPRSNQVVGAFAVRYLVQADASTSSGHAHRLKDVEHFEDQERANE